jgi:hypothetical protein
MAQLHLRIIAGNIAIFFFAGCVWGSSVFGAGNEGSAALSVEQKGLIMGAEKMKKRKKSESEKKSSSDKKREKEKLAPLKNSTRGGDLRLTHYDHSLSCPSVGYRGTGIPQRHKGYGEMV